MRRGQMKMMETFGVMVVFFFLLIIGTNMYSKYQERQYMEAKARADELKSIQISQKALYLPELNCVDRQLLCFDAYKVRTFYELSKNNEAFKERYNDLFGVSNITIKQVYPTIKEYTIYVNPPTDPKKRIARSTTSVPIMIHDPIDGQNAFGVLNVDVYQND
jgi:hypothetical protein